MFASLKKFPICILNPWFLDLFFQTPALKILTIRINDKKSDIVKPKQLITSRFSCQEQISEMYEKEWNRWLLTVNFNDVKLFHVKLGVGINDDLFTDISFKIGYEHIFFTKEKFCNLRIDPES